MASKDVFLIFFVSTLIIPYCLADCFFPDYLQGEFSMQSLNSLPGQIKYTPVSITPDLVNIYGYCHKKMGNGNYLIANFNGNSSHCLKCIHISAKSQNIIVVRLAGHTDRCFFSSQAAESSCPKPDQLETARQIILFKSKEEIRKEFCPLSGRYMMHYRQNKPDYPIECTSRSSQLDNCPVGSEMNLRFRDCHFENHDLVFECLGSWNGPNQQRYLALFDTRSGTDPRPQFRCGLYREDPGSGTVYIAFSSDSTCITDLQNAQSGFETLILTRIMPRFPLQLAADRGCRFPSWTEGRWELVNVQGKIFTYTDLTVFKKYVFQCVEEEDGRDKNYVAMSTDERILVVGRTECNEEIYSCIWLKKRGENVFEFQLATETSQYPNSSLCSVQNFQTNVWITQGRKDLSTVSPCPISGEYIGTLPNVENLCAKLSSDCVSQDTMHYMVADCLQLQTYEEREYRCLGQWQENDFTYTFTQRTDTGMYECFVGTMISESEILVREAGKHCGRNMNSMLEMKLTRKSSCPENHTSSAVSSSTTPASAVPVTTTKYTLNNRRIIQHTTRPPWRSLDVTRLPPSSRNRNGSSNDSTKIVPSHLFILFILHVVSFKSFYIAFTSF